MPYISEAARKEVDFQFRNEFPRNAGELNYVLTLVCKKYVAYNGGRYQQINDVVGALEGCKLEFYRRLAAPYEDGKIKENGDVY